MTTYLSFRLLLKSLMLYIHKEIQFKNNVVRGNFRWGEKMKGFSDVTAIIPPRTGIAIKLLIYF